MQGVKSEGVGKGNKRGTEFFQVAAKVQQAVRKSGGIFRIRNQKILQLGRIALGHAGVGTDQGRQTPAKGFVNAQSIGFIASRMNQNVASSQDLWNIFAKS